MTDAGQQDTFSDGTSSVLLTLVVAVVVYKLSSYFFKPKESRRKMRFLSDYEKYARETIPEGVLDYYSGGAGCHSTIPRNTDAFNRICLMTRILHPILHVDLRTRILDRVVDLPIGIAPTAMRSFLWPDGDRCIAQAAADAQVINIVPMMGAITVEDVSKCATSGINWLQITPLEDNAHQPIISRAENAGFQAIVVTVDGRGLGHRSVGPHKFTDASRNARCANFNHKPINKVTEMTKKNIGWRDVDDIISKTSLPVIIKGVLNPEDAITAVSHGVRGVIVSNHGGRQMDGVPAPIEMLPAVHAAVGDQIDVYLDSGVRTGSDVLKALALGAKCVFLGRPVLYGLSYQGEEGVGQIFDILKDELKNAMIFTGCSSVSKIPPSIVMQPNDPRFHIPTVSQ
ncbi:2-Hydroxyacid oxidase 2-like isoform X2 [Ptychodera flava]|uniref:2-Hydroxyacid oxidase 2-like isoform X2 n=1 Tax=Ptychodera flava TaxID=63121 RepID=UPI00396A3AF3